MTPDSARKLLSDAGVFYGDFGESPEDAQTLNMNDTFGWALAWGLFIPDDKLVEVAQLFCRYGEAGLVYWASQSEGGMRSEFHDINRQIDFAANEERIRLETPDSNKRAYREVTYMLGTKPTL